MPAIMFDATGKHIPARFEMKRVKSRGEIWVYGDIGSWGWGGDGVSAAQFQKDLKALGDVDEIDLHINSVGGVVADGMAMRTLLVQHKATVTSYIDGICASAAVALALAGKTVKIADGGFMMIHNARAYAFGEASDMRRQADLLDKINVQVAEIYSSQTDNTLQQVLDWMSAETWMTAKEAVEMGFADEVMDQSPILNMIGAEMKFTRTPKALAERPRRIQAAAMIANMRQASGSK